MTTNVDTEKVIAKFKKAATTLFAAAELGLETNDSRGNEIKFTAANFKADGTTCRLAIGPEWEIKFGRYQISGNTPLTFDSLEQYLGLLLDVFE